MSGYNIETLVESGCASFRKRCHPRTTPQLCHYKLVGVTVACHPGSQYSFVICGGSVLASLWTAVFPPRCVAVSMFPRGAETRRSITGKWRSWLLLDRLFWRGCWRGPSLFGRFLRRACWQNAHCGFCAAAAIQSVHDKRDGFDSVLQALEIVRGLTLRCLRFILTNVRNDEVYAVLQALYFHRIRSENRTLACAYHS